jgi:glycyl-tRNA synthetase alpha chain
MQVVLKPPPADIQDIYLGSLKALGIHLREHDIRFEEDNWEAPTLGAWGIGWQVMLDGLEITQFTYFQQCGGLDLNPISVEITYGLERIAAFLQNVQSVYEIRWSNDKTYRELRFEEELQLSVYDFEAADPARCRRILDLYEEEAWHLLKRFDGLRTPASEPEAGRQVTEDVCWTAGNRFPLRKAYELCLKCSHLFNILDARGAISVTERVALIARIRKMAVEVAKIYVDRPVPVAAVEEVRSA